MYKEVKAGDEKGEMTEKIIQRELQFQEKKIQMRLSERKMQGFNRKLRSLSRESFHTSPSVSFELPSLKQRSESNAMTARTKDNFGSNESSGLLKSKVPKTSTQKSELFLTVTEENEDDIRFSIPSQRETVKLKSTEIASNVIIYE